MNPVIIAPEQVVPPKDLFNPPGILKEMFKFCEELAQVSQPELSVVGALALASVSCGRLYRTTMNNFASLYFMLSGNMCGCAPHPHRA